MGWKATLRAMEAVKRRQERDAQRRQRESERQAKAQAKLSEIEMARLQVEDFERHLDCLLSIHKEQSEPVDWREFASSLPPPPPQKKSYNELRTRQQQMVLPTNQRENSEIEIQKARERDIQSFEEEIRAYSDQKSKWEKLKNLSLRVLGGEHKAYIEALIEFNPFAEIISIGSSINFIIHNTKLVEAVLKIHSKQAIPDEIKTLTASGKISIRPMPKSRFNEIYRSYLSGCVLRVARELLALLPIDVVLITASADLLDSSKGRVIEQPVLSIVIPRSEVLPLNFDLLDPYDALSNFQHNGDFKAGRKSENFQAIVPLTPADIIKNSFQDMSFDDLLVAVRKDLVQVKIRLAAISAIEAAAAAKPNLQI